MPNAEHSSPAIAHQKLAMEVLTTFAEENPFATAMLGLGALWAAANYLRSSTAGVKVGAAPSSRDDAMRAARERQQANLAAAAAERRSTSTTAGAPSVPKTEVQAAAPAAPAEMPSRMKAALERQQREEAAAKRSDCCQEPSAPPPPPASNSKRKETTAEKVARIQGGKGPSEFNPMNGSGSSSSAGGVIKRKKGGG